MAYKNKQDQLRVQREWYARNKEQRKQQIFERRNNLVDWFKKLKSNLKCEICFESDYRCLDFHHNDPKIKETNIGTMIRNGYSKTKILQEINKCQIVCANCHRKIHRTI